MTSLPYTNIQKGPINLNVYQDENEKLKALNCKYLNLKDRNHNYTHNILSDISKS